MRERERERTRWRATLNRAPCTLMWQTRRESGKSFCCCCCCGCLCFISMGWKKKIETSWKTYKSLEEKTKKTKRRRRRRLYEIVVVVGASQSRVLLFFLKLLLASGSSRWCQTVKLPLITAKQQQQKIEKKDLKKGPARLSRLFF